MGAILKYPEPHRLIRGCSAGQIPLPRLRRPRQHGPDAVPQRSSYALGDQRSYDAWGGVRAGNAAGEPNARHVANLGHLTDDESGLVYMRARYYEPGTGRFVSQDPARDGLNWFVYADNNPIDYSDPSGRSAESDNLIGNILIMLGMFLLKNGSSPFTGMQDWAKRKFVSKLTTEVIATVLERSLGKLMVDMVFIYLKATSLNRVNVGSRMLGYMMILVGQLYLMDSEFEGGGGDWWGYDVASSPFFP